MSVLLSKTCRGTASARLDLPPRMLIFLYYKAYHFCRRLGILNPAAAAGSCSARKSGSAKVLLTSACFLCYYISAVLDAAERAFIAGSALKETITGMDITHQQVSHRQFGIGNVTGQTETTVTVKFGKEFGIRKFLYPTAFESFLVLSDSVFKERMESELTELRQQAQSERISRAKENAERAAARPQAKKRPPAKKRAAKVSDPAGDEEPPV